MLNLKDRKSKISFLNELRKGRRTIQELREQDDNITIHVDFQNGSKFFNNGKEITEQEFAEHMRNVKFGEIKTIVSTRE